MLVGLWRKIISMIRHIGRIGRMFLKDAEALTIYWHSPPYNSSNIETYNGQRLKVVNLGNPGDLCAEYISDNRKM